MDQVKLRRLGGVAGIAFVILVLISFFIPGDPPGFNDSSQEFSQYLTDNRGELQVTMALWIAAGPVFLLFLGALVRVLRIGEGQGPATLTAVAYGGGLLFLALILLAAGMLWAAAYHEGLEPELARSLYYASNAGFLLSIGVGMTALVGASAAIGLATGRLGRWLNSYGAVLAAYTFVIAIVGSFAETGAFNPNDGALPAIATLGFLLWVVWTGVVLISRTKEEPPA